MVKYIYQREKNLCKFYVGKVIALSTASRYDTIHSWYVLDNTAIFVSGTDFKRVCYFTTWSNHLQIEAARFKISDIDPFLCTHAIFAFAKVNTDKLRLEKLEYDDDNGLAGSAAAGKFYDFTKLKNKNSKLTTMLSIGGASMSESLHLVTETSERRIIFARNCGIFLRDRHFDGLDIDWEFPGVYRDKFTELLKVGSIFLYNRPFCTFPTLILKLYVLQELFRFPIISYQPLIFTW